MRIKDVVLRCVGYVAEAVAETSDGPEYDPVGTGFFVSVPSEVVPGASYSYFVTARHVAHGLKGKNVAFLVNKTTGGRTEFNSIIPVWYTHRDTDLALTVVTQGTSDLDVIAISARSLLTEEIIQRENIGIGDDVFLAGLFVPAHGRDRNLPIVRMGNVAMIPTDQIYIDMGDESRYVDAYLIETRSIGGVSGSPVFVRPTHYVQGENENGRIIECGGVGSPPYLLGLMHGHWDVKEAEINRYNWTHDSARGVNIGIGIVIPAKKILELLNDPDIVRLRTKAENKLRERSVPHADSGIE